MKKLLFIALLIVLGLFSGCGAPKVASMSLFIDAGTEVPPFMFTEDTLDFTPDYAKRDLDVKYREVFLNRTEETTLQDIDTEGLLGGDFFDSFNVIVKRFEKPYETYSADDVVGGSKFKLKIKMLDGTVKEYDIRLAKNKEDFNLVNDFYGNVTSLFTQDIY